MKFITDIKTTFIFLCDGCGRALIEDDFTEPCWEDYDRFLETVGQPDEEPTLFLCRECLAGKEQKE